MSESLTTPSPIPLPAPLRSRLTSLRLGLWRQRFLEWGCLALAGVGSAFLGVWLSDRLWDTPSEMRLALLLLLSSALGASGAWMALRWGWRFRRWLALGRLVRQWDRRAGDRVLAALELTLGEDAVARSESPRLREAAIAQLSEHLSTIDFTPALHPARLHRISSWAVGIALLAGSLILIAPQAGMNAAQRCFFPWSTTERYTFVQFGALPKERIVPHGETTTFRVSLKPDSPWKRQQARMHLPDNGQSLTAPLKGGHYQFTLPAIHDDQRLLLSAGDARHEMRLLPKHRPGLETLGATLTLPDYLQHPEHHVEIAGGKLEAIAGSQVRIKGAVTRELTSAELRGIPAAPLEVRGRSFETPPITLTDPTQVAEFVWVDRLGLEPKDPLRLELVPVEDRAPRVDILADVPSPITMLAGDSVTLALRAEDDFGLSMVGYLCGAADATPEGIWKPSSAQGQRIREGHPEARHLDADFNFSPQTDELTPGTWQIWGFAKDYRPGAPPQFSAPRALQILTQEQHATLIRAEFRNIQEQLETVTQREAELKQANETLQQRGTLDPDALGKQREAEETATKELGELAQHASELLQQAMKNAALDTASLEPWSKMLGAMQSVAQQGMPQAARSLAQAQAAASSGEPSKSQAALKQAIAQQEANLKQLAEAMGHGHETGDKLEAATFVNRLRQAATEEETVATTMRGTVTESAGLTPSQLDAVGAQALDTLATDHETTRAEVDYLMGDLDHYHRRTKKNVYGEVHRQMVAAGIPAELVEVTQRVERNQHGRVILNSLQLARQFHHWADALAAGKKGEEEQTTPQEGSGENQGKPDAELMLAIMRLVQKEMTLRDQTRAVDGRRASDRYPAAVAKLAGEQRAIGFSVAGLLARVMAPDLQQRLRLAASAIDDAAALLDKPETGGETIAAQTEVIELLAQAAKSSGQMGGNSKAVDALAEVLAMMELGNSPGGNASGGTTNMASSEASGEMGTDGRDDRRVDQTTGLAGGEFPEEYREILGHFFEQRERLRKEAATTP